MLAFLLSMFIIGLIVGFLARLIVPGHDPMGILGTALLGIVGSFVGGMLASLLFAHTLQLRSSGWIGSIIGAVIALLVYRASYRRRAF
jgi:uncharacterized membrane protein YeaQ/YmgE (transglycosylase-associated protein family)